MKILALFFLVLCLSEGRSQNITPPARSGIFKVGSATTYWSRIALTIGGWKDITVYSADTDTDTLKVAFARADTVAANQWSGRVTAIFAGERVSIQRIVSDTLWVRSSGTSSYIITGVVR